MLLNKPVGCRALGFVLSSADSPTPPFYVLPLKTESKISLVKDSQISLKGIRWTWSVAYFLWWVDFPPWKVSFGNATWKHHHSSSPSQESHKMLLAITWNAASWLHWSPGRPEINYTWVVFRNIPGYSHGVCIVKTVRCQGPDLVHELIGNWKTKSIQLARWETIKWFASGEGIAAQKGQLLIRWESLWSFRSVFGDLKDEREMGMSISWMAVLWNTQVSFKQEDWE